MIVINSGVIAAGGINETELMFFEIKMNSDASSIVSMTAEKHNAEKVLKALSAVKGVAASWVAIVYKMQVL